MNVPETMQDPGRPLVDLHELLDKLNAEAEKSINYIKAIRVKGTEAVRKAEAVLTESVIQKVRDETIKALYNLTERLVEINCDLELADDYETPKLVIPYISVGSNLVELKFLTGDNPWNFWLIDDSVDVKNLHKNLLKKYQNQLLDSCSHPKPSQSVCFLDRNKVYRGIISQVMNENRVKVSDCDSNISKVVACDKVFNADPDACYVHASAIRCTISKESSGAELWNTDLRDVFCNSLKEAILHVKILEKLPGDLPTFLVDVGIKSEDDEYLSGNLKEWIMSRLVPELKKLSCGKDEMICDFLSSEALNPYYIVSSEERFAPVKVTKEERSNVSSLEETYESLEELNNLNAPRSKISNTIVKNADDFEQDKVVPHETNVSAQVTSSSEEVLMSINNESEKTEISSNESQTDTKSDHSTSDKSKLNRSAEFNQSKSNNPQESNKQKFNQSKSNNPQESNKQNYYFGGNLIHNPHVPQPPQNHHQPIRYLPYSQFGPACLPKFHPNVPSWPLPQQPPLQSLSSNNPMYPPSYSVYPPQPIHPWNTGEPNRAITQANIEPNHRHWSPGDQSLPSRGKDLHNQIANVNNINVNVNVMAPEFIPGKMSNSQKSQRKPLIITDVTNAKSGNVQPPPDKNEIFHVDVRKPTSLLNLGDRLLVMISHVESPSDFYIHFVSKHNAHIDKLSDEMFAYYNTTDKKVQFDTWREAKTSLGKFCACKWLEDNHWYRVEVLDWALGDNMVKVFFVDYGNRDIVPLSCLQPLDPRYTRLSMCAQPCHLAKVHPLNKQEKWSVQSIEYFKSKVKVSNEDVYSIIVVPSKDKEVNSLSVLLYEGKHDAKDMEQVSINDQMAYDGMAWSKKLLQAFQSSGSSLEQLCESSDISIDAKSCEPSLDLELTSSLPVQLDDGWDHWNPQAEDFNSLRNNPAIDTDDPGVALIGYSAKDEARICKFFAKGHCWKDVCTKEHSVPNKDHVTTDKEEVYCRAFSEVVLPLVGEVIRVKVTAVSSISIFYVQLQQEKGCLVEDDDEMETITSLWEFMNLSENVHKMKLLKIPPALGQLVIAKYNDSWYRARVISADIDDDPEVMFVDYGSSCCVSPMDLREMEPRYLHLPFQAIECSIANIIPPELDSPQYNEGTELLKETIQGCIMTAKVYESLSGETFQRMEVLLEDDEYGDIGEYLIEEGHATKNNISWGHSFSLPKKVTHYPG